MKALEWSVATLVLVCSLSINARGAVSESDREVSSDTPTNIVLWLVPPAQSATNQNVGVHAASNKESEDGSSMASSAYKFIVLPLGPPPSTNYTLVGVIKVANTNAPGAKRAPDQVFVIDNYTSRPRVPRLAAHLDADLVFPDRKRMTWGDWLKPDRAVERWLELWTIETNATPVVIFLQEI